MRNEITLRRNAVNDMLNDLDYIECELAEILSLKSCIGESREDYYRRCNRVCNKAHKIANVCIEEMSRCLE